MWGQCYEDIINNNHQKILGLLFLPIYCFSYSLLANQGCLAISLAEMRFSFIVRVFFIKSLALSDILDQWTLTSE